MNFVTPVQTLSRVFRRPLFLLIAVVTTSLTLVSIVWWQNWKLIVFIFSQPDATLLMKLHFLLSLLGGLGTNFSLLSAVLTCTVVILLGMQVSLLIFYIKRVKKGTRRMFHTNSASMIGILSGLFGIGCAACGSIIATTVLTTIGAGGLLLYLPLHGSEFGLLGVGLLLYSIWLLLRKINDPFVCTP